MEYELADVPAWTGGQGWRCKRCGKIVPSAGKGSHWYQAHVRDRAAEKCGAVSNNKQQRHVSIAKGPNCKGCLYLLTNANALPCYWCTRRNNMKDCYSLATAT